MRRKAKSDYYNSKSLEYKTNTKKLWKLTNQTIGKCKNDGSITPFISIEDLKTYDPKKISNAFGKFYSGLGESLTSSIKLLYTSGPVSLKERLLYTLNKLFVKQVKSFLLLLDLDPFILQCSLHNIKYIKFTSP